MQPKNTFDTTQPGSQASEQLQAWIAGPDSDNENAVVVLPNYGPDQGQGGFGTSLQGTQFVNVSPGVLGIAPGQPNGQDSWNVRTVLGCSG
jgi:alpha-galactosidase